VNWLFDWDWKAAEAGFRIAISLDPGNASAHRTLGHALSQTGRHNEAESEMRRAREIEPLDAINHALSSQVAFQTRQYSAAVEHARRTTRVDSEFWIGYMQLGQAYAQLGNTDLALEALTDAARLSGGNSKAVSLRGYVLAQTGRASEAREVLKRLEALSRERYGPPYAMAIVHAGLGEREAVFDWLDKAYAARDVHLIFLDRGSQVGPLPRRTPDSRPFSPAVVSRGTLHYLYSDDPAVCERLKNLFLTSRYVEVRRCRTTASPSARTQRCADP